jgi:YidC/Oxa1 family membrane protein insertase
VLPLVTVGLFLLSMKMSMPEPTNEQAVMQQKMMKYMTGFMGLMFYKVASGLCIYFIASSIWGLGERQLLNKTKQAGTGGDGPQDAVKRVSPPSQGPTNGSSNGYSSSAQRKKAEKARKKR